MMIKYVELNSNGMSKDSQLRAAKVFKVISDSCEGAGKEGESFESILHLMAQRWKQLRTAAQQSGLFSLPEFSPRFCSFLRQDFEPQPAFAWLKCAGDIEDCESFLRGKKILARGGTHFGVGPKYVRISMLDRDNNFNNFVVRLSSIRS